MVKLSKFSHTFDLENAVAYYHSLRMKPVFLTKQKANDLQAWLASPFCVGIEGAPDFLTAEVQELVRCKILTRSEDEDERVLAFVRAKIPEPAVCVCYLILTEQCNLACKYCFLGNNHAGKRREFLAESMSAATAEQALGFFVRQIKMSNDAGFNKPVLIFYGGEPLINFDVLEHIAEKANDLRKTEPCIAGLEMSVVTNGLLLDERRLLRLRELGVSIGISIDGFTEKANAMRVDVAGKPIFERLLSVLDLSQRLRMDISLSVTLSEETIDDTAAILDLIDRYGIKGFGFNIMMSDENFVLPQSYNEKAARYIIEQFVELRKRGVYEDRMMRKLKAFTRAQVYHSDCAATAGGQIAVAPDGRVGICHGCLHDKQYFVTDIYDDDFSAKENEFFVEWSKLSPVNNEACHSCPALGICGGGCPINAMHLKSGNTIHSRDERFCVHSIKTLEFLIRDLYRIVAKEGR